MSTTSTSVTSADFDQAELDRLYWLEQNTKVSEIAERIGVSSRGLNKLVTPHATGETCLICRGPAVARSRSQLASPWLTCRDCGAACSHGQKRSWGEPTTDGSCGAPLAAVEVSAAMIRRNGASAFELGCDAHSAVHALRRVGRPLNPAATVTVLDAHDGIDEIRAALDQYEPATLGLSSLRTVGDTQTEAIQNLFHLTRDGWCVVSGHDSDVPHPVRHTEMEALFYGDHRFRDDRWEDECSFDPDEAQDFGDRVINATRRFGGSSRWW